MKKKILVVLMTVMLFLVGGCFSKKESVSKRLSFESLYDYSAITGINLLNSNTVTPLSALAFTSGEKEEILSDLKVVENMLSGGVIKSDESVSDKEGYSTMYTITTTRLDETKDVYTFHFNETLLESDEKDEQESKIEGIVLLNENEYSMIGEKEVEGNEIEMKFKIMIDQNNYVIIEQELESDEQEFEFTQYSNGVKVYQREIEFESESENKVEFEFKEKTLEGTKAYKYEFITKNNKKYIEVEKKEGNKTTVASIEVTVNESNEIVYTFVE